MQTEFDPIALIMGDYVIPPEEAAKIEAEMAEIARRKKESDEKRWAAYAAEEKQRCPKCCGTGRIDAYRHIDHGICFRCGGTGKR